MSLPACLAKPTSSTTAFPFIKGCLHASPATIPQADAAFSCVQTSRSEVWAEFTNEEHTFYRGPILVGKTEADTAEECAEACQDKDCLFWAWCPNDASDG